MKQETANSKQETANATIRGTQSFVSVMVAVWKRPSLTGLEVLWRWLVGAPLVAVVVWEALRIGNTVQVDTHALAAMTVFKPVDAAGTLSAAMDALLPAVTQVARWFVPLALAAWMIVSAFGRTIIMRRLDTQLMPRPWTLVVLGGLRILVLVAVYGLWYGGVQLAGQWAVMRPVSHGGEPNLVLYAALLICGTLALFVAWAASGWLFDIAPVLAMLRGLGVVESLRQAGRPGPLRGKLIEINLVMGIVRIALIVLAMVFSACPLPFESVETQGFLVNWSVGVAVLYLLASDYFHVVRAAAYVSLCRIYEEA
ncbi:MAG TPA: hypothetical protein VGG18_01360 [Granulicella sp.]